MATADLTAATTPLLRRRAAQVRAVWGRIARRWRPPPETLDDYDARQW